MRDQLVRPTGLGQQRRFGGTREASDDQRRPCRMRALRQHVAGVRVGHLRITVQVVAVVPHRGKAQVVHRCEHCRAGSDHDACRAAQHCQPAAVARGWRQVGGEGDHAVLAEQPGAGVLQPLQVAVVGDDDQRASSGRRGGGGGFGEPAGPVFAG